MRTEHQMMRRSHACTYATADALAAEPGQIITCWCGEPARVEADGWVVAMGWRERRRWRKEQRRADRWPERGGHASGSATINELPPPPDAFMQRPTPLEGKVVEVPMEARIAAKALRTASDWLPDQHRDMLREAAYGAETVWDGGCCPICQETWCDDGCPLEDVRAKLMKGQR